jgi:hypothetical protein
VKKKREITPEESRIVIRGTHEAIITEEQFELAQSVMKNRYRPDRTGERQIFSGLVRCASCGSAMNLSTSHGKKKSFACTVYRNYGKDRCTSHRISYNALYRIVLDDIREYAGMARYHSVEFYDRLVSGSREKDDEERRRLEAEVQKLEQRIADLNTVLNRLYEDYALGRVTGDRYRSFSESYESELKEKTEEKESVERQINSMSEKKINADRFFEIIRKYTDITELTAPILNELIDRIIIYEKEEIDGEAVQNVVIFYKFAGKIE